MDIVFVLSGITTLSTERKEELRQKYEQGILSEEDKSELKEHALLAAKRVAQEVSVAESILQNLSQS